MPRRIAGVLAAAIQAAGTLTDTVVSPGRSLAFMAKHFLDVWQPSERRSKTRSRKARDRDLCQCQVPGCSRPATQAHHVMFRSQGGGDEQENLVGLCAFHHLRCIHGGYLRVFGRAPDQLTWFLGGKV
jgi:hypothetical protein